MKRLLRKLLLGLGILIIGVFCTHKLNEYWKDIHMPELTKNLKGKSFADQDADFKQRVNDAFPAIIQEKDLVEQLKLQGFQVGDKKQFATYKRSDFVCNYLWQIDWENAENGMVQINHVAFGEAGCL